MTRFDLHIHTALSACADNGMSPAQVLRRAASAGLATVALVDHNASEHSAAAPRLAERLGLHAIPAMEITTREEIHVLTFFDDPQALRDLQVLVDRSLPDMANDTAVWGRQLLYDDDDNIIDSDDRLRQVGVALSLEQVVDAVRQRGGVTVPSHVYRSRHSLTSQLGWVAAGAGFSAVEIGRQRWQDRHHRLGERVAGYPVMTGSDAHFPEDVGRHYMEIDAGVHTVHELMAAL